MEIALTPEQEARLDRIAECVGMPPTAFVVNAIAIHLQSEHYVRERIGRGIEQADADEFIEEEKMDARFEKMIRG